ncbi:hypothetical protein [Nitrospirillum amazonense]|nr:hypothetical protein [Nitrospirillum amazonense]
MERRNFLRGGLGLAVLGFAGRAGAGTTYYRYDGQGRLKAVVAANGSASTYLMDNVGNRTALQVRRYIGDSITSDGFDAAFYDIINSDVAAAGVDPYQHYENNGWHEGRDPSGYFSTTGYLSAYSDIAAAGVNPLSHYNDWGWREGRNPSSLFNTRKYLNAYSDIAAANINPLVHYLQYGAFEGRLPFGDGTY